MESAEHHVDLSKGAYHGLDKAREYADKHNYDVIDDDSDKSKIRNHTLYKERETGQVVLSFRGTALKRNKAKDLLTDAQLAIGLKPKELKEASKITADIKAKYGDNVIVSGHSKGGALAIHSGKTHGLKSVTHNPYIGRGMKKGLKSYFKNSDSEVHLHVDDVIGTSAVDHIPHSNIIAYTHDTKKAHSIKSFHGKEGVRLSEKKSKNIRDKIKSGLKIAGGTIAGATATAVGLTLAKNKS